jgi:hypothetical protein
VIGFAEVLEKGGRLESGFRCQVSALPPANLKYFLPQSGQKKQKFAGLIIHETSQ